MSALPEAPAEKEHLANEQGSEHLQRVHRGEEVLDLSLIWDFEFAGLQGKTAAEAYLDWLENQERGKIAK